MAQLIRKRTLRERLLTWFLIFSVLTISLTIIFNITYFNKKANISTVISDIYTLQVNLMKAFSHIDDMFSFETANMEFHETRAKDSKYLKEYKQTIELIFTEFERLSKLSTNYNLDIDQHYEGIWSQLKLYDATVDQMLELILQRGFKDAGTEGRMREYVHLLENFPEINQVQVLSLRRHEKDYIIRNEPEYVHKLNKLSGEMRDDVLNNPYLSAKEKDSIKSIIDNYTSLFNQIVSLDQKIGIKDNKEGLKKSLNDLSIEIEDQFEILVSSADLSKDRIFKTLQILYMVFFLIWVAASLYLSWYISKKITSPLSRLTEFIGRLIHSNFKKTEEMELDYSHREIDHLYFEFNNMIELLNDREVERDKAEYALKESELKYRELAEMLPLSIYETNEVGNFTYVNKTWNETFGYTREDIENGLNLIETITSDSKEMPSETDADKGNECVAMTRDGKVLSALVYSSPIIQSGVKTGYRGIVVDITERKKYIEALKREKIKAEESDRLKSAFLANMSHEIRTPMNAIIGFSDLLSKLDADSSDRSEFIRHIKNSGNLLLNLIDDIIDIAKIEAGELKIKKSGTYINQILNEIQVTFKEQLKRNHKGNKIALKISMPDVDDPPAVLTDPFRLKQILTNLISNAIKFTEQGYVHYGYKVDNDHLLFFVEDTGIGLSDENQRLIFERFRQVEDTHTRKYGGAGLGLAISKNLVELLGGNMWLESEINSGTTFYFRIPLIVIQSDEEMVTDDQRMNVTTEWEGKKLLIVEDEETNYLIIKEALKKSGIGILWARNGQEAVDLCRTTDDIDIILMDIQMPVMNGYEATRIIKKLNPELPVISQTAYTMAGEKERSLEAGCDDYLPKPINMNLLMVKISQQISRKKRSTIQYQAAPADTSRNK